MYEILNEKQDILQEKTTVLELDSTLFCLLLLFETAGVMKFFYFVLGLLHDWVSFY